MSYCYDVTFYRTIAPLTPFVFAWSVVFLPEEENDYFRYRGWLEDLGQMEVEPGSLYEVAEDLRATVMLRIPLRDGKPYGEGRVPFKSDPQGTGPKNWKPLPHLCGGWLSRPKKIRPEHLEKPHEVAFYAAADIWETPRLAAAMSYAHTDELEEAHEQGRLEWLYETSGPLGEALQTATNGANIATAKSTSTLR